MLIFSSDAIADSWSSSCRVGGGLVCCPLSSPFSLHMCTRCAMFFVHLVLSNQVFFSLFLQQRSAPCSLLVRGGSHGAQWLQNNSRHRYQGMRTTCCIFLRQILVLTSQLFVAVVFSSIMVAVGCCLLCWAWAWTSGTSLCSRRSRR